MTTNRAVGLIGALSLVLMSSTGQAQPVIDQFVSSADVITAGDCSLLRINFHVRMAYKGLAPPDHGVQVRVSLRLIDQLAGVDQRIFPREGIRIPNAKSAGIESAYLALDEAEGPVLQVQFLQSVSFQVVQSGSLEALTLAIARKGPVAKCKLPQVATDGGSPPAGAGLAGDGRSVRSRTPLGPASDSDIKTVEGLMDDARAAMRRGNQAEAAQLFKKVLSFPENKSSAEAQELLGAVDLKLGFRAQAVAEFEDYLRRYPQGEGADRVRQRLAGIMTADGPAQQKLDGQPTAELKKKQLTGETRWTMSGSVSASYITDDSTSAAKDLSLAANPLADPDAHRVHQNTLLTNFDAFGTSDSDQVRTKFKLAFTQEHLFETQSNLYGVSTAEFDYTLKDYDITARIGRQSRNTGGVIGRFDGAVVSWQESPDLRLNVLAGSPNWSRFDAPFKDGKTLYGVSADFNKVFGFLDTTLFAIGQYDQSIVDRQGIGAEFRYFDKNKTALGTIDYDVHFQQLNAAIFSGTYTLADQSVINTALDYRRVPYLSSWNALQGQPFLTLYDMMRFNTAGDIRQFAIDRTPLFESAMVSYSRPLNATYQISADATATNLSGTPPSGGVDGTFSTGLEYYLSTQLTGSGVFRPGDLFMAAVRYAKLSDSNLYVLDLNTRFPFTPTLAVSPRFRVGYRDGIGQQLSEVTVLPSMLVSYLWSKDMSFETELGYKYVDSTIVGVKSITKDLFGTVTIRKDFGADGSNQCRLAAISCAWAQSPALPGTGPGSGPTLPFAPEFKLAPAFAFEAGLRYWYSTAKNSYTYFADPTPSAQVSRLSYGGLAAQTGEIYFRLDANEGPLTNMYLKGSIGGGGITKGKLIDEDFSPFIDPYSMTRSDAGGQLFYGNIDLGYNIFQVDPFRFSAFVGFQHWQEKVDARGCSQIAGNPFICGQALPSSLRVITERDRWEIGRAGVAVDALIVDRLTWHGEFALAWTSQHAMDTHYFTFGDDPAVGTGWGFQTESFLSYQLTSRFKVGLGARWWHLNTGVIDSFDQLLRYTTDRYGLLAQASYRFF